MKTFILLAFFIAHSHASSKIDNIIKDDSTLRLNRIEEIQANLKSATKELSQFQQDLKIATKSQKQRKVFVIIRNTAAVSAALTLALTATIYAKTIPASSEGAIYGLIGVYGGSILTAGSALIAGGAEIGVYLNKNDAENLGLKIKELQKNLSIKESALKNEVNILCKEDPRHILCY